MVNIFRLCVAVFCLSAINFSWAGKCVSPKLNDTWYYTAPCFGGAAESAVVDASRYRALPNGAIGQTVRGGITMNAAKIKAPWYARFGWSRAGVQAATRTGLKAIKRSGWGILAGLAIEAILKEAGWFEEDGQYYVYDGDFLPGRYKFLVEGQLNAFTPPLLVEEMTSNPKATCAINQAPYFSPGALERLLAGQSSHETCRICEGCEGLNVWLKGDCGLGYVYQDNKCKPEADQRRPHRPVTAADIDKLDLSGYQPSDRDADWLRPHLGRPETQHYDDMPSFQGDPQTTINPDGTTTETQTQYQPQINPQDGAYNPNPVVNLREKTRTRRYRDGEKIDDKTDDKDVTPGGEGKDKPGEDGKDKPKPGEDDKEKPKPGEDGKQNPGGEKPNPGGNTEPKDKTDPKEKPQLKDCDLMPTLCKWMKWTQEDVPEEPDLGEHKREIDVTDIERHKTISFGAKQCPAPYTLDLAYRSYQFEFDQYCEFARNLRLFVLAAAYIFAARILIGSARS